MRTKYFDSPKDIKDLRDQYYKLAMKHHPDRGGDVKVMQEINAEYELLLKTVGKHEHFEEWSDEGQAKWYERDAELRDILDKIIHLPDIDIEIVGDWIWVHNCKHVKDELKAEGFRWSPNKTAWYWHAAGYRKRSRESYTMEEIRQMHGSTKVRKNTKKRIGKEEEEC